MTQRELLWIIVLRIMAEAEINFGEIALAP